MVLDFLNSHIKIMSEHIFSESEKEILIEAIL
jgi:hypothetical protein